MTAQPTEWRNLYGRRRGKKLRAGQSELIETLLPRLAPPGVDRRENPERRKLDLGALLPGAEEIWLEIGFGGGEHMVAEAHAHPKAGIIGCEHFLNGVAKALAQIEREGVENIRIHHGDARDLTDVLPDAALARAYLLYPDPWPKARHVGRRYVNPENLDGLARVIRPGAGLHVASDIPDYIEHSREVAAAHPAFTIAYDAPGPWAGWPSTRYEAKAIREGRSPHYLILQRA